MKRSIIYGCEKFKKHLQGVYVDQNQFTYLIGQNNTLIPLVGDKGNNFHYVDSFIRMIDERPKLVSNSDFSQNITLDRELNIVTKGKIEVIQKNIGWVVKYNSEKIELLKYIFCLYYNENFFIIKGIRHENKIITIFGTSTTQINRYFDYYNYEKVIEENLSVFMSTELNCQYLIESKVYKNLKEPNKYRFAIVTKEKNDEWVLKKVFIFLNNELVRNFISCCYWGDHVSILFENVDNQLVVVTEQVDLLSDDEDWG